MSVTERGRVHRTDSSQSIVFIVAFALLIPVGIWRFAVKSTRTPVLIRPLIFCVLRVATYVVRAMMANGSYSIGIISAALPVSQLVGND